MDVPTHPNETLSNRQRIQLAQFEPRGLRTQTPSLAVITRSAGVFHWTLEGRRLFDFTSGVLVANLGHNRSSWQKRFFTYMGWTTNDISHESNYFPSIPLTAYNAATAIEIEASSRLIGLLQTQ